MIVFGTGGYIFSVLYLLYETHKENTGVVAGLIAYLLAIAVCLVIPGNLHGAIVGEREKRTWDLLVSAPVSLADIMRSKWLTGVGVLVLLLGLGLPLILACSFNEETSLPHIALVCANIAAIGLFAISLSLWFSVRSRSSFAAQSATIGSIVFLIVFPPMIASIIRNNYYPNSNSSEWQGYFPVFSLGYGWAKTSTDGGEIGIQIVALLLASALFYFNSVVTLYRQWRTETHA